MKGTITGKVGKECAVIFLGEGNRGTPKTEKGGKKGVYRGGVGVWILKKCFLTEKKSKWGDDTGRGRGES